MQPAYSIAVLPGDGIGTEVMAAALTVLQAAGDRCGRRFETVTHPAGAQHFADTGEALPEISPVCTPETILKARELCRHILLERKIEDYILNIVFATRQPELAGMPELKGLIAWGASPRATIFLARAARAHAFLRRRGFVTPDDIKGVAADVLRHRIGLSYEAQAEEMTSEDVVARILNTIEVA